MAAYPAASDSGSDSDSDSDALGWERAAEGVPLPWLLGSAPSLQFLVLNELTNAKGQDQICAQPWPSVHGRAVTLGNDRLGPYAVFGWRAQKQRKPPDQNRLDKLEQLGKT